MFFLLGMECIISYLDFVSINVMQYELPWIDVGEIGPQRSEVRVTAMAWQCVTFLCGYGRILRRAQPEQMSRGGTFEN